MTRDDLAALIDCDPNTLWRWEANLTPTFRKHDLALKSMSAELRRLGIENLVRRALR